MAPSHHLHRAFTLGPFFRPLKARSTTPFKFPALIHLSHRRLHCSLPHQPHSPNSSKNQRAQTTNHYVVDAESFYFSLLENSATKSHLSQIHAQLIVYGLCENGFLITKLINVGAGFGEIQYARKVFDEFPDPDVFLWNAVIRGCSMCSMYRDVVEFYSRMQSAKVSPDRYTLPHVIKACRETGLLGVGRTVHGKMVRCGFGVDVFLENGLVAFYGKCGRVDRAKVVFEGMVDRTIVSWTSIISAYVQHGYAIEALRTFGEMRKEDVRPDWITLVSVIKAYTDVKDLEHGKSVHGCVIKMGLEMEEDLLIALTALYAKCGGVMVARRLFDLMDTPSLILWNAMISGYTVNGYAAEAVELFKEMVRKKVEPDSITVSTAISACAQVGSHELARWIDGFINSIGFRSDLHVNTALVDMYIKCGNMDLARAVFDRTDDKDVVMWSAMIMGFAVHGQGNEAIELFHAMSRAGVWPNGVAFLGLLTACKHSCLVTEGWDFFHSMKDYGIIPRQQHYACLVDIFGRAGYVEDAYNFIASMPSQPGLTVWGALLSACKIHRHLALGEYAAKQLLLIEPQNIDHYVQLSNLYASARMWDQVSDVRRQMKERGLCKDLGYSQI
ncbi:hypothetical protein Droror1_Dr00019498 [Drosera rotundifolia]